MDLNKSVTPGIVFQCQQCGTCCSKDTEGYVFVYQSDIDEMVRVLGLSREEFAEKYLQITDYEYTLWDSDLEDTDKKHTMETLILSTQGEQADCVFLYEDGGAKKCRIYGGRPLQCRLFPFWSIIMVSSVNYEETKQYCLGLNSPSITANGSNFYSPDRIEQLVKEERKLESEYYRIMKKNNFEIKKVYPYLYPKTDE